MSSSCTAEVIYAFQWDRLHYTSCNVVMGHSKGLFYTSGNTIVRKNVQDLLDDKRWRPVSKSRWNRRKHQQRHRTAIVFLFLRLWDLTWNAHWNAILQANDLHATSFLVNEWNMHRHHVCYVWNMKKNTMLSRKWQVFISIIRKYYMSLWWLLQMDLGYIRALSIYTIFPDNVHMWLDDILTLYAMGNVGLFKADSPVAGGRGV